MNEENVLVITDREELYDKCENMEQLFDKYYLPLLDKHYSKTYKLQQENARLKEENQALLTLVNWFEECGMGFDNIAQDDIINWEKFEEETEDMGYIESMIYYAKKYNEKQNLKEN